MSQLLQSSVPYPESFIWQLHHRYFQQRGEEAWKSGEVPSGITSNTRAAYQNASVVLEALKHQHFETDETVYIMEVGSGSGQFAVNFLNCFHEICSGGNEHFCERLHYMATDYARNSLEALSVHPDLKKYKESGRIGFYLFDVLKSREWTQLDGSLLEPSEGMLSAVIANYIHCALPMTIFRRRNGEYEEKHVAIRMAQNGDGDMPGKEIRLDELLDDAIAPGIMGRLKTEHHYVPVDLDSYVVTPEIRQAVRSAAFQQDPATIPVPAGTCLHLKTFKPFLKENGVYLISDKGFTEPGAMTGDLSFLPSIHGNSMAHQLNFPLIGGFARSIGFSAFSTEDPDYVLKTMLLVNAQKPASSIEERFRRLFVESNGNIDASDFEKAADLYYREGKWKEAGVFFRKSLRLRENSPHLLLKLARSLMKLGKLDEAFECCREGKTADTLCEYDFDFEQGLIQYRRRNYADAIAHYRASESHFGGCKQGYYNMGLCWAGLKEVRKAHDAYSKALETDSGYQIAKDAIDDIKDQVFSEWLAVNPADASSRG